MYVFKFANTDDAHSVYLHVYYITSMRVSLRVSMRRLVEGGGSGCGERSAQRLSSGRWCDTVAGRAQTRLQRVSAFFLLASA